MENTTIDSKPISRRPHKPKEEDRVKVARMASMGIPQSQIAVLFGISVKTLRMYYKTELVESAVYANLKVIETLYHMATSGENTAAAIFWAKTRCGFRSGLPDAIEPGQPPNPPKSPATAKQAPKSGYATEPPAAGNVVFISPKGERVA